MRLASQLLDGAAVPSLRPLTSQVRLLLAAALALPAWAGAQVQPLPNSVQLQVQGKDELTVSAGNCDVELVVAWQANTTGTPTSDLVAWATTGDCGNEPGTGADTKRIGTASLQMQRAGQFTGIALRELPAFRADGGTSCGAGGLTVTHQICASFKYSVFFGGTESWATAVAPPTVTYDSQPPPPPVITDVTSLDGALSVQVASSEALTVHLDVREVGAEEFQSRTTFSAESGRGVIPSLTNGVTYEVRARAEDAAGNVSEPSEVAQGTPLMTEGFFARYKDLGGGEEGGCTSVAAAWPSAALALVGVWQLARRRRR